MPRPKVSVIVPVFNPGRYLARCADSVVRQSLPATEYEAIFVDDGSTDTSPAALDALAARHANVRVVHQQNSGWPGQPRNLGIDLARGEYVFFLDHDDALGRDALERLYDFATQSRSDVAIGKTAIRAGDSSGAPATAMTLSYHALFARTRDHVTLWDAPIIESLTPHKLFRRAFLVEHGLRFPEGRRRLEDHVFVLQAFFAASVISVLAGPVCYERYQRADRGNASTDLSDPAYYYRFVREVLGVVEAHTEPGPRRDALLQRFARVEILDHLRGPRFLGHPAPYRARLFDEIRSVVEAHLPVTVDTLLGPFQRTQLALIRAGRLDLVVEAARWHHALVGRADVTAARRTSSGTFELRIDAGLAAAGQLLAVERRGERFLLDLPGDIASAVPDEARAVSVPVGGGASVRAMRRSDRAELAIPCRAERRIEERKGRFRIIDVVDASIDPGIVTVEHAPRPSTWDILVRLDAIGASRTVPIAQLRVTSHGDVLLHRSRARMGPLTSRVRRIGLAGVLAVSRHMDDRLRRRLWRVASRVVRRLDT
jgi:glycosyltransferase involved in cell wall biosynthesis